MLLDCLEAVYAKWQLPVIVSTHPRTRKRLEGDGIIRGTADIRWLNPFGFHDYNRLQLDAFCVLSDSGTVAEESSMLGFSAVTLRDSIERPEALDAGAIVMTGLDVENVLEAIDDAVKSGRSSTPDGYDVSDTSDRVVRFVLSTAKRHHAWAGIHR